MKSREYVIVCINYGYNHSIREKKTLRLVDSSRRPITFYDAIAKAKEIKYSGKWDDVCLYQSREELEEIAIVGFRAPYPKTVFGTKEG